MKNKSQITRCIKFYTWAWTCISSTFLTWWSTTLLEWGISKIPTIQAAGTPHGDKKSHMATMQDFVGENLPVYVCIASWYYRCHHWIVYPISWYIIFFCYKLQTSMVYLILSFYYYCCYCKVSNASLNLGIFYVSNQCTTHEVVLSSNFMV